MQHEALLNASHNVKKEISCTSIRYWYGQYAKVTNFHVDTCCCHCHNTHMLDHASALTSLLRHPVRSASNGAHTKKSHNPFGHLLKLCECPKPKNLIWKRIWNESDSPAVLTQPKLCNIPMRAYSTAYMSHYKWHLIIKCHIIPDLKHVFRQYLNWISSWAGFVFLFFFFTR